jgi:hypothetical protein
MSIESTYWGIFCRTCRDPVAFDKSPYHRSAVGVFNLSAGAIRCTNGHDHIYFPRDFAFFSSEKPIVDAVMQDHCVAYRAINLAGRSDPSSTERRESASRLWNSKGSRTT